MKIENDMDFVDRSRIDHGIATVRPFKVNVQRYGGKDITPLMDEIERAFRVYQYRKDNGVKYGEEELFFWTNTHPGCLHSDGKMPFFSLALNDRTTPSERLAVLERLLPMIERWDGNVVGERKVVFVSFDGTKQETEKIDSYASVCYRAELVDSDALHAKAVERINEIGDRTCKCGGMVGRFRHDCDGTLFKKHRTRKFYKITDEAAACAELV